MEQRTIRTQVTVFEDGHAHVRVGPVLFPDTDWRRVSAARADAVSDGGEGMPITVWNTRKTDDRQLTLTLFRNRSGVIEPVPEGTRVDILLSVFGVVRPFPTEC